MSAIICIRTKFDPHIICADFSILAITSRVRNSLFAVSCTSSCLSANVALRPSRSCLSHVTTLPGFSLRRTSHSKIVLQKPFPVNFENTRSMPSISCCMVGRCTCGSLFNVLRTTGRPRTRLGENASRRDRGLGPESIAKP